MSLAQRGYIGRFLHEGAQGDALGDPSGIRERRVPLEHLVLGRTDHADLEEVVHDPEPGHPRRVGVSGDTRKRRPDSLRGVGPGEFRDLDAKLHVLKGMPVTWAPLPRIPRWGVASAIVAPIALIGGWLYAGSIVPGYDPVRQTISDLAARDEPHRGVMTHALVLTGVAHIVTAVGLRPADVAGRGLLALGGVATLIVAWIPNSLTGHNVLGHMIATYLAFAALSVWPAVIAPNRTDSPVVLRLRFGQVAALVLLVLVAVVIADIVTGSATLGLRERVLTGTQALTPLVVVLGTVVGARGRRADWPTIRAG